DIAVVTGDKAWIVNNTTGDISPFPREWPGMENAEHAAVSARFQHRTPRWKFQSAKIPSGGRLTLTTHSGNRVEIRYNDSFQAVQLSPEEAGSPWVQIDTVSMTVVPVSHPVPVGREVAPFRDVAGPPRSGYRLQCAVWKDGRRAWIDSRGLLHLKHSDATLPQVTLVLRDGILSGWLSTGHVFGEDYYCGHDVPKDRRTTAQHAWETAIQPFTEL
ncbi:MAG: hypothetical protein KDA89_17605, partial [Planctomycetaceae bacterium]|nr:hypothetical protein [Planctomycetaceae bacterium]